MVTCKRRGRPLSLALLCQSQRIGQRQMMPSEDVIDLGVQKLARSGLQGISKRDFWKTKSPSLRHFSPIYVLDLRADKLLAKRPLYKQDSSEVSKRGWRTERLARGNPRIRASFLYPFSYAPLGEGGHISGELLWLFSRVCLSPTPSRQPLFETFYKQEGPC